MNHCLSNPTVSLRAKGVYSILKSHSDILNFKPQELFSDRDRESIVYRALKELAEKGYIYRTKTNRHKKGVYYCFDEPTSLEEMKRIVDEIRNKNGLDTCKES